VQAGRAPAWVAFVIVGRELVIMGLRGAVSATNGTVVKPSVWGKVKANAQFLAIFLAIWRPDITVGSWRLDQVAMAVAAVVTIASGVEYLARFGGVLVHRER
jgi:CDP-diacylglycerol--glycerol-3-phosphate 3-phosphatidyltransferase